MSLDEFTRKRMRLIERRDTKNYNDFIQFTFTIGFLVGVIITILIYEFFVLGG